MKEKLRFTLVISFKLGLALLGIGIICRYASDFAVAWDSRSASSSMSRVGPNSRHMTIALKVTNAVEGDMGGTSPPEQGGVRVLSLELFEESGLLTRVDGAWKLSSLAEVVMCDAPELAAWNAGIRRNWRDHPGEIVIECDPVDSTQHNWIVRVLAKRSILHRVEEFTFLVTSDTVTPLLFRRTPPLGPLIYFCGNLLIVAAAAAAVPGILSAAVLLKNRRLSFRAGN